MSKAWKYLIGGLIGTIKNNYYGLKLHDCESNLFIYNTFKENINYSIQLHVTCKNNTFHHNSFIGNNEGDNSQACDEGMNNNWYDSGTNEGTYWPDRLGGGNYSIAGSASAVDPYSLINPLC